MSDDDNFEFKARAAFERIEDQARQLGLYVDRCQAGHTPDGRSILIADFVVGDVAFSDRVQFPQKAATNSIVESMEQQMLSDSFLDQRARLKAKLETGEDLFSD